MNMKSDILGALTTGIADLPTLPAVVTRVMQITNDPESSAHDLMKIIAPDAPLTVKILKMANSAFYGRVRKAATLEQALTVLGFSEIRNIVLATAMFNTFRTLNKTDPLYFNRFWEHSFLCGLAAKLLANRVKLPENEMFIIGLIHDIGKLAIWKILPSEFSKVVQMAKPFGFGTLSAEEQVLGITHDEIGGRLLNQWLFPKKMVAAIKFHHHHNMAGAHTLSALVIHLADRLARINSAETDRENGGIQQVDHFSSEIASDTRSHGIEWNTSAVQEYQSELETQKAAQTDIMEIFLP